MRTSSKLSASQTRRISRPRDITNTQKQAIRTAILKTLFALELFETFDYDLDKITILKETLLNYYNMLVN